MPHHPVPPTRAERQKAFQAAQSLQQAGRWAEAERAWSALARDLPGHAGVQANLAMVLWRLGRTAEADTACDRALAADPNMVQALAISAACAEVRDDPDAAIERYRRALDIKPDLATAVQGLANLYVRKGDYAQARAQAERLTELAPAAAAAWAALGAIRLAENTLDAADAALAEALRLDPNLAAAHANRGAVAAARRDWPAALAFAETALGLDDRLVQAHANRGNALASLGRRADAEAAFDRALALDPADADALYNRALLWLTQGRWADAWPGFEARWRLRDMAPWRREFAAPKWDGAAAPESTLLIHGEQGIGDAIMMARYLPMAAARVGRLVVECHPRLRDLLAAMPDLPETVDFVAAGETPPAFDMYLPIMSLPGVFSTTPENVPWDGPYISPLPARQTVGVESQQTKESPHTRESQQTKVGITWAGNPDNPNDRARSLPLAALAPVFDVEGCAFFSLQFGPGTEELASSGMADRLEDLGPRLGDFATTAAWVAEMDVVITVCTAMAHLAGAMGKPTWVLLASDADWRWLEARADSPWYPTARLFRQADAGDWPGVAARVADALKEYAETGGKE